MLNTLVSPLVDRTMAVSHIFLWQLLLASAWANTAQTGLDIRFVGTVPAFQRAVNDAVKHIVLTEHISAISAQQEIEGSGESLDTAIGSIQPDTKSIVVCPSPQALQRNSNTLCVCARPICCPLHGGPWLLELSSSGLTCALTQHANCVPTESVPPG